MPVTPYNCACSSATDVVVISYNPQHYKTVGAWNTMLDVLVLCLHEMNPNSSPMLTPRKPQS